MYRSVVVSGACALLAVTGTPAAAQAPGPGAPLGSARQAVAARVSVDSMVALASPRVEAEIEAELAAVSRAERVASDRRTGAERSRDLARAAREEQVAELDRVREAIAMADDLEQESRKSALESERKLRERYRDLIAVRVEVHEGEMNVTESESRRLRAMRARLEAERRVSEFVREWSRLHGEDAVRADAEERRRETERQILERLKKYFETERDEARERERLAEAERDLADRRLKLLEHRRNLFDD